MIACPVCQKGLEIDERNFGAISSCPECRAVFYVGWDGTPELGHHEPDPVISEAPVTAELEPPTGFEGEGVPHLEATPAADEWRPAEEPAPGDAPENPSWSTEAAPSFTPAEGGDFVATPEAPMAEPEPVSYEAPPAGDFAPVETAEPAAESPYNFDQPLGAVEPPAPAVNDSGDFADVTSYANSDAAAAGPMSYLIVVRGLELADTFEKLREALTDSRFGWDVEEVMATVRAGELRLKGLNPTKASILVSRIKYLPVELEWKQEVFSAGP